MNNKMDKMKRRDFLRSSTIGSAAIGSGIAASLKEQSAIASENVKPPNIVWIWCDNLAYQDLGVYGNKEINTPVIDRLATRGVRLTQYYIAHTVCSPSRAALLTGRQPFRTGIVDVLRPDSPTGIPKDEITLAEVLRDRGYATAAFGKWHLGDRTPYLPTQHGFDSYFGLPYSMDMLPTILYRDNEIIDYLDGDKVQDITERMVDEAIGFIDSNKDRPFFMYFSHTLPHPPINLPPEHRSSDASAEALYRDAIEYMDYETGRIIDSLEQLGLTENTLIVFSSDNGPMAKGGNTGGLRGRIRDSYEGGIRVPFIASWPGRIPEGKAVDTPAIAYDVFPTLTHLAGSTLPSDRIYDGQDIWPVLTGKGEFNREKPFVWVYLDNVTSVRDGNWKFHVARRSQKLDKPELYNLEKDPYESNPVNGDHPEVVARLEKLVQDFQKDLPKVWRLQYPVMDPQKRKSGVRRE